MRSMLVGVPRMCMSVSEKVAYTCTCYNMDMHMDMHMHMHMHMYMDMSMCMCMSMRRALRRSRQELRRHTAPPRGTAWVWCK